LGLAEVLLDDGVPLEGPPGLVGAHPATESATTTTLAVARHLRRIVLRNHERDIMKLSSETKT